MRLSAKTFAAMLMCLALAAFQFDSYAQSRGTSRSSSTSRTSSGSVSRSSSGSTSRSSSGSVSRSSSESARKSTPTKSSSANTPPSASRGSSQSARPADKPSASKPSADRPAAGKPSDDRRPSGNVTYGRPSGDSAPAASRPDNANRPKPDISPADRKPASNKPSAGKPSGNKPSGNVNAGRPSGNPPAARPSDGPKPSGPSTRPAPKPAPDFRPGDQHKPIHVNRPKPHPGHDRVHPRDRGFLDFNVPSFHWVNDPHYYGYRVKVLPVRAKRHLFGGVVYYSYDNVWYRRYDGYYVVCRPPFGTSLAADLISGLAWTAVNVAYYNTVANTYDQISENNAYIAQQNAVIAQNNATIAAQNSVIAQSQNKAQMAYGLANELGLVQSLADAGTSYFYQDGVFYTMSSDGKYHVIVPPAGALVESLPEDFDTVVLNGREYFRVDDTIYKMTISDGKPYFEVLGQMN